MRNLLKKLTIGLLPAVLLFVIFAGPAVKVNSLEPPTYNFSTWKGSGDTSAYVPGSKFLKLVPSGDNEEISPSYYTITAEENYTIITLKEAYLKTLDSGLYFFNCYFSGDGEESLIYDKFHYETDAICGIELTGISSFYNLSRITYEGENIDPSYYTATNDKGYNQIIFNNEEYWKTLQQSSLKAYFTVDHITERVRLAVMLPEPSSDEEATSDPPVVSIEETTSDSSDADLAMETSDVSMDTSADSGGGMGYETDSNSKTGSDGGNTNGAAALWVLVIVVASASGCAALGVVLLKRYKSKKERD